MHLKPLPNLRGTLACALVWLSLLAGCATPLPQIVDDKLARLDKKAVALMTITFSNQLEPEKSLLPITLVVQKKRPGDKPDDESYERYNFNTTVAYLRTLNPTKSGYLVVMENEPGEYILYAVRGYATGGFLQPLFEAPLLLPFAARANELAYLGNVHLVLRKKNNDDELRAGPMTPLIDQTGVGDATFDVRISDRYDADLDDFKTVFPNLGKQQVVRNVMPAWKRPKAAEFTPKLSHFAFY